MQGGKRKTAEGPVIQPSLFQDSRAAETDAPGSGGTGSVLTSTVAATKALPVGSGAEGSSASRKNFGQRLRGAGLPPLLTEHGLARRHDPDTSQVAAHSVEVPPLEQKVLSALRQNTNGLTSEELAQALRLSLVSVSPRLRPLANKKLVVDSGIRRATSSGRSAIVWRVA